MWKLPGRDLQQRWRSGMRELSRWNAGQRCPADIELDWLQRLSDWHLRLKCRNSDVHVVRSWDPSNWWYIGGHLPGRGLRLLSSWLLPAWVYDSNILQQLRPRHHPAQYWGVVLHFLPGWQILWLLRRQRVALSFMPGWVLQRLRGISVHCMPCRQAGNRCEQGFRGRWLRRLPCWVLLWDRVVQLHCVPGWKIPGLHGAVWLCVLPGWL